MDNRFSKMSYRFSKMSYHFSKTIKHFSKMVEHARQTMIQNTKTNSLSLIFIPQPYKNLGKAYTYLFSLARNIVSFLKASKKIKKVLTILKSRTFGFGQRG